MIDSIIFDLDGTLWDSSEQLYQYWHQAFPELSREVIKKTLGKTVPEMSEIWNISVDQIHQVQQGENLYLRRCPGSIYPGLKRVFKKLKKQGLRLFISSNCQTGYIETFLLSNRLGKYFESYICYGDTGQSKKLNVQNLIQNYYLSPVLVGDTYSDEIAAESNNIPYIWAEYGFGKENPPENTIVILQDIRELPDIVTYW